MSKPSEAITSGVEVRYLAIIIIALAVAVFIITWFGIKESRSDSMQLLVMQGKAFVESLTEAANSAIEAERFFDYLVHKRFSELVIDLAQQPLETFDDDRLLRLAADHNLYGIFVFATDSTPVAGGFVRGSVVKPPEFVLAEINQIIAEPENNYVLLLDAGDSPDETVHYYIEITNNLDRVILVVADALYYVDALSQTQIGYLSQKMAQERGVDYIIFQSTEGIIFSSRRTASLLAIESDPFLTESLDSDTIRYRQYEFEETPVLEMVRPFATVGYPFGLLRVGLSLENYAAVSKGYDRQMIMLSGTLFVLVLVVLLYLQTRRKRREIDLQYREIKSISDKIFEEMKIGVAAVDARGTVILANNAFERILGVQATSGTRWDDLVKLEDLAFDAILARTEPSFESEFRLEAGSESQWLLIAVSKMTAGSRGGSGLVAVVYDITRLRQLERKAARKERLSEMGNMAAGVAHEIRNPLNTISIAAQRLAGEFAPSANQEEYLSFTEQIRSETKRLNEIITRFLALAREESQKTVRSSLSRVVGEFVELVKYEAKSVGIDLNVDVEPSLEVLADSDSLKQVLSNLFNNAKEALEGKAGKISITGTRADREAQLRFGDSGPGIARDVRDKIFTPFYTTKGSGTGLGLPTVYKIISDLGGDVRIEDSRLGGAEFIINLPLS
ncbi:MAG: PAS domain S-box protein [Candidatus Zixiibacteriota bacterium]|nr:MAG: PAS domain S-box protein [candidate division Zixibacteria bacterium]